MIRVPFGTSEGNTRATAIGTRTQPCDTGATGTYESPWMAKPRWKYTGLYISPSSDRCQPWMRRIARKLPAGVMA